MHLNKQNMERALLTWQYRARKAQKYSTRFMEKESAFKQNKLPKYLTQ